MSSVVSPGTTRRPVAALAGLLFIVATISFAVGNALLTSALDEGLRNGKLLAGVLLQAVCGASVVVIGFILRDLLSPAGPRRATAYLALRVLECATIIAFGVYFLITPEPLSHYDAIIYAFTGVGGVILCSLLRTSGAAPGWLCMLGLLGYGVLLAGVVAEFAGGVELDSSGGFAFLAPGSVFEVMFPALLILRGLPLAQVLLTREGNHGQRA
jgi:hypothetical protein